MVAANATPIRPIVIFILWCNYRPTVHLVLGITAILDIIFTIICASIFFWGGERRRPWLSLLFGRWRRAWQSGSWQTRKQQLTACSWLLLTRWRAIRVTLLVDGSVTSDWHCSVTNVGARHDSFIPHRYTVQQTTYLQHVSKHAKTAAIDNTSVLPLRLRSIMIVCAERKTPFARWCCYCF